jgi:type II secretory pathway predicted ATPase ExeA
MKCGLFSRHGFPFVRGDRGSTLKVEEGQSASVQVMLADKDFQNETEGASGHLC